MKQFFKNVASGISSLFTGNPEVVLNTAKGIGSFIDESFHTEQEKSEANLKLLDLKIKMAQATSGQNLARRYCAMFFGLNFIVTFQVCLWVLFFGWLNAESIDDINNAKAFVSSVIDLAIAFQIGWIMIAIIAFYFMKEHKGFTGLTNTFKSNDAMNTHKNK
jgi:hypothetical protein